MSEEVQRGRMPQRLACSRWTRPCELLLAAGARVPHSVGNIWPELAGGRVVGRLVPTPPDQGFQLLEDARS